MDNIRYDYGLVRKTGYLLSEKLAVRQDPERIVAVCCNVVNIVSLKNGRVQEKLVAFEEGQITGIARIDDDRFAVSSGCGKIAVCTKQGEKEVIKISDAKIHGVSYVDGKIYAMLGKGRLLVYDLMMQELEEHREATLRRIEEFATGVYDGETYGACFFEDTVRLFRTEGHVPLYTYKLRAAVRQIHVCAGYVLVLTKTHLYAVAIREILASARTEPTPVETLRHFYHSEIFNGSLYVLNAATIAKYTLGNTIEKSCCYELPSKKKMFFAVKEHSFFAIAKDNTIRKYEFADGQIARQETIQEYTKIAECCVCLVTDGKTSACVSSRDIKIWTADALTRKIDIPGRVVGFYQIDEKTAECYCECGTVFVVDLETTDTESYRLYAEDVQIVSAHRQSDMLAVAHADNTVELLRMCGGGKTEKLDAEHMSEQIAFVRLSATHGLLFVAFFSGTVSVRACETLVQKFLLYGHKYPVLDLDYRAEENELVTCSADKSIKVWHLNYGECKETIYRHAEKVSAVRYIDAGFVSCGHDGLVNVFDRARRCTQTANVGAAALGIAHDGSTLAVATEQGMCVFSRTYAGSADTVAVATPANDEAVAPSSVAKFHSLLETLENKTPSSVEYDLLYAAMFDLTAFETEKAVEQTSTRRSEFLLGFFENIAAKKHNTVVLARAIGYFMKHVTQQFLRNKRVRAVALPVLARLYNLRTVASADIRSLEKNPN